MGRFPRPLSEVLAYRHAEVIYRFCDEWPVTPREANAIFDDVKRFLWLCGRPNPYKLAPVGIVDEMWHSFLMFTIDYREFGQRYFGKILDHVPTTRREKLALRRRARAAPERAFDELRAEIQASVEYVYDNLDARTAIRWYVDYPKRYGPRFMRRAFARRATMAA